MAGGWGKEHLTLTLCGTGQPGVGDLLNISAFPHPALRSPWPPSAAVGCWDLVCGSTSWASEWLWGGSEPGAAAPGCGVTAGRRTPAVGWGGPRLRGGFWPYGPQDTEQSLSRPLLGRSCRRGPPLPFLGGEDLGQEGGIVNMPQTGSQRAAARRWWLCLLVQPVCEDTGAPLQPGMRPVGRPNHAVCRAAGVQRASQARLRCGAGSARPFRKSSGATQALRGAVYFVGCKGGKRPGAGEPPSPFPPCPAPAHGWAQVLLTAATPAPRGHRALPVGWNRAVSSRPGTQR